MSTTAGATEPELVAARIAGGEAGESIVVVLEGAGYDVRRLDADN